MKTVQICRDHLPGGKQKKETAVVLRQWATAACVVLVCVAVLAGCGSSNSPYGEYAASSTASRNVSYEPQAVPTEDGADYDDYAIEEAVEAEPEYDMAYDSPATGGGDGGPDLTQINQDPRKIIYSVDISLQTTTFDDGVLKIPALVEGIGGFVQDSYVQGTNMNDKYYSRHASFTARVPADDLDQFISNLGDAFHIVYQQKSSTDITNSYYDTQARLDSLRIQEERLIAMLEEATELQYMLEVERELANVLYEIESMTSALQRMDSSVSLSTVTISLQEVNTYEENTPVVEPITFGERMRETFGDSWDGFVYFCQGVVLFLIALVPFLPVFIIVALVIILAVRISRKRRAKRGSKQPQPVNDYPPYPVPGQPESSMNEDDTRNKEPEEK